MYNLTKMELYKLFRMISVWVILGVTVIFCCFNTYMTKIDLEYMSDSGAELFDGQNLVENADDETNVQFGIYLDVNPEWINGDVNVGEFIMVFLQSGVCLVFVSIFASIFVSSELSNGYIKNIAGQLKYKGMLVLSKIPALLVFNVLVFAVGYLANIIFIKLMLNGVDFSITADSVKLIFIQLLLHFSFSCVVMALTSITRSKAVGITFGILFSSGIGGLIWSGINLIVNRVFNNDTFDITKYSIVQCVTEVGMSFDFDSTARVILVGSFFVVVAVGISMSIANKRDVR